MDKPKYVAEGFEEDAKKVMKEFIEKNTAEFSAFAEIWRKNHFSLVFWGRPDKIETSEFINEMFRISANFLSSPSFYEKVGSVYLLYALYRNQITDPPVKIRVDLFHWKIIRNLHKDAKLHQYRTLHYVIDYLIKNAFIYVAKQTLKGPLIGSMQTITKRSEEISNLKAAYKSDIIEYSVQNNLKELRDLNRQYFEAKKSLDGHVKVSVNDDSKVYEGFLSDLDKLVNPVQRGRREGSESLGSRRAKIKAASFVRKVTDRFGQSIEDDSCETDQDPNLREPATRRKVTRTRRVPKHERRVGRPSKKPKIEVPVEEKSDDDNIDISYLIDQQNDLYLPPEEAVKKMRCKPGRYYYKVSPKREGSESSGPEI